MAFHIRGVPFLLWTLSELINLVVITFLHFTSLLFIIPAAIKITAKSLLPVPELAGFYFYISY